MKEGIELEALIDMNAPRAVFGEVCRIVCLIRPKAETALLETVFEQVLRLFYGDFPGYRGCNTPYHNLKHTTDCLLSMARLLHGASLQGMSFNADNLVLGLVAAVLHDTGYIQRRDEGPGTGAQFTRTHIERSIAFMELLMGQYGQPGTNLQNIRDCMRCTGVEVRVRDIVFESREFEFLGKALGTADLLGQMADRAYIQRLPLLYREFREGNVPGFADKLDFLRKTPEFWEFTKHRLANDLGGIDAYMVNHFRVRWGIDCDLYRSAVERNISHLVCILEHHGDDCRGFTGPDEAGEEPARGALSPVQDLRS